MAGDNLATLIADNSHICFRRNFEIIRTVLGIFRNDECHSLDVVIFDKLRGCCLQTIVICANHVHKTAQLSIFMLLNFTLKFIDKFCKWFVCGSSKNHDDWLVAHAASIAKAFSIFDTVTRIAGCFGYSKGPNAISGLWAAYDIGQRVTC